MQLRRLWLTDFRNYHHAEMELAAGTTALVGANGQGKTNLLEAVAWLATLASFRGAPAEALVRHGAPCAVVRAEGETQQRELLVEAQIAVSGRNRVQVNRQPLQRSRDLLGVLRVTVFSPEDLELVKGAPAARRRWMDDVLVALHPQHHSLRAEVSRALAQRGALLRQIGGMRLERLGPDAARTLDVWDAKLAEAGGALVSARRALLERLCPALSRAWATLAGGGPEALEATYVASWPEAELAEALRNARRRDLRSGVSTVGPHRDDLALSISGLPARTHASQGEQRCLALALRLAAHEAVTAQVGAPPLLLLDDVFSELDPRRSDALLANLPAGQALLTSATDLPAKASPARVLELRDGAILRRR